MLMQHGDGERLLSKSNVGRLPSSHHPALPLSLFPHLQNGAVGPNSH